MSERWDGKQPKDRSKRHGDSGERNQYDGFFKVNMPSDFTKGGKPRVNKGPAQRWLERKVLTKEQKQEAAHNAVRAAVKAGTLPEAASLECVDCGKMADRWVHHNGYEDPLDVVPMCASCAGIEYARLAGHG